MTSAEKTSNEVLREWVIDLRGNMTMEEFAGHIYRFKKDKKKGIVCGTVHRNTISNWVNKKTSIERDVEVFLSLILMKYDRENAPDISPDGRSRRYIYAKQLLNELIGVDLYCRHLHDAMLFGVCRGILSFEELPQMEKAFEKELKSIPMAVTKKDEYAMERNTIFVENDLNKVMDKDDLAEVITVIHRNTFASANRTIGARLDKIYQSRDRYGVWATLPQAIDILAPNYRDSYIRMYSSSFISREWMIDLCRHLKFDDSEIDEMLESAHMALLNGEKSQDPYKAFRNMNVHERLEVMLMLGLYIETLLDVTECPPIDCLLEAFSLYDYGSRAFSDLSDIEKEGAAYEDCCDKLRLLTERSLGQYAESMFYHKNYNEALCVACKEEKSQYFQMSGDVSEAVSDRDMLLKLHLLATLMYTVLAGKEFSGSLKEADLVRIRDLFDPDGEAMYVYRFLSQVLGVFLSGSRIQEKEIGGETVYSVLNEQTGRRTEQLNMESILTDLWESVLTV